MKRTELKRKTPLKAKAPMKKSSRPKMTKIRASARGQRCMVQVPGVCNGNPETVVLAHRNGAGMGCKADDKDAAYACSACHEWLDGGYVRHGADRFERDAYHEQGIFRTRLLLVEQGLIKEVA